MNENIYHFLAKQITEGRKSISPKEEKLVECLLKGASAEYLAEEVYNKYEKVK